MHGFCHLCETERLMRRIDQSERGRRNATIAFYVAIVIICVLSACSYAVPTRTTPAPDARWCLVAQVQGERVLGCSQSRQLCERAYRAVRQSGRLVGVTSVDGCREVGR
jgi:hypothetical protein